MPISAGLFQDLPTSLSWALRWPPCTLQPFSSDSANSQAWLPLPREPRTCQVSGTSLSVPASEQHTSVATPSLPSSRLSLEMCVPEAGGGRGASLPVLASTSLQGQGLAPSAVSSPGFQSPLLASSHSLRAAVSHSWSLRLSTSRSHLPASLVSPL